MLDVGLDSALGQLFYDHWQGFLAIVAIILLFRRGR